MSRTAFTCTSTGDSAGSSDADNGRPAGDQPLVADGVTDHANQHHNDSPGRPDDSGDGQYQRHDDPDDDPYRFDNDLLHDPDQRHHSPDDDPELRDPDLDDDPELRDPDLDDDPELRDHNLDDDPELRDHNLDDDPELRDHDPDDDPYQHDTESDDDPFQRYADHDLADQDEGRGFVRIKRRPTRLGSEPRLVAEGRSGRRQVELDPNEPDQSSDVPGESDPPAANEPGGPSPLSSYDVAQHGPLPVPDWVITDLNARDTRLGALKSGKEADVTLLERALQNGPGCLLAVKTYRSSENRMFHRDSGYLEGRRTRRSRETRAMAKRTRFGRDLLAGRWAAAEFSALSEIWSAGANVPYPVQLIGSELMMQFIGEPDGTAAPRLAAYDTDTAQLTDLWHDIVATLHILAETGRTHGDLSPYNVLVQQDRCVLIDLPQVVDVVANPQGAAFLRRDCDRIADFFARRGVLAADGEHLAEQLWVTAAGSDRPPPVAVLPLPQPSPDED